MREGLKKRIKGDKNNTLNLIKKDYIFKNTHNKRMPNTKCSNNGNCSNTQNSDGHWVGADQIPQQTQRLYYAPFRQPLKGYRKSLDCDASNQNNNCWASTEVYKDTYSNCTENNCIQNGSISTSKVPVNVINKTTTGNSARSARPIIRSGMQPNVAGQQNSGLSTKSYSYSYRELLNNRRKDTIIKKMATSKPVSGIHTTGYGGSCDSIGNCEKGTGQNIYRLNNEKFKVQGAVSSGSRIDRLKLDTIRGQSNCPSGTKTGPSNDRQDCNGIYFAGKPRSVFGPAITNTYDTKQRKYKDKFNINHTEVNYPQISALARVRGAVSHKTTANPNGGICCNNTPPQLLM